MASQIDARLPVVVSFAAGDEYYHRRAERLAAACDRLGIDHSIDHLEDPSLDWVGWCRRKVRFYREKLDELGRPIVWLDVDTDLRAAPETLRGMQADFAAFTQGTGLRDLDPYRFASMWRPGLVAFNDTAPARAFLEHMEALEAAEAQPVTDAYLLQRAWSSFEGQLSVLVLPSTRIARHPEQVGDDTWILDGHSGNVAQHRAGVAQLPPIRNPGEVLTAVAADYLRKQEHGAAEAMLLAAEDYGYDSIAHAQRLAAVHRRRGRRAEADEAVRSHVRRHLDDGAARLLGARTALEHADLDGAQEHLDAALALGGATALEARSLQVDLDLERRAAALGVAPEERPAMWWMKRPFPGNLGDALSPYVVERVSGLPPRFVRADQGMLAIGSIIRLAGDDQHVWGSGTPRMSDELNPRARYGAVRGPLTRELVRRSGGAAPEVLGDPALLLPRFYAPEVQAVHELGVIQHVADRGLGRLGEGVVDLDLRQVGYGEMESVIDRLLTCRAVVSTSLHGLVLAAAYGIPARWARFSGAPRPIAGDGTKFLDFLRSVGLPDQEPLDLSQLEVLDDSLLAHVDPATAHAEFDAEALLESYPGPRR